MAGEVPGLEISDEPDDGLRATLLEGLIAQVGRHLGPYDRRPIGVFARDGEQRLLGGLAGETTRSFLYVHLFWVEEAERGRGLGSRLLLAAEAESLARGCHSAALDTFDFQARPFYERHGYTVFGTLDGYPNGHRRFYMVKRLAAARGG